MTVSKLYNFFALRIKVISNFRAKELMNKNALNKLVGKKGLLSNTISINDLREKEYSGSPLTTAEKTAIANYEHYRLTELNKHVNDAEFNKVYQMLQVMANLKPWEDFLKEEYFER